MYIKSRPALRACRMHVSLYSQGAGRQTERRRGLYYSYLYFNPKCHCLCKYLLFYTLLSCPVLSGHLCLCLRLLHTGNHILAD